MIPRGRRHRAVVRHWRAPRLSRRVALLNPSTGVPVEVWAHRYDRRSETVEEEGLTVYIQVTTWTIAYRDGVDPDVEIIDKGAVYRSVGPAALRGEGRYGQRWLQIATMLRQ